MIKLRLNQSNWLLRATRLCAKKKIGGEKMVERESALGSGSQMEERKRLHNFSAYEIEVITNNVKKNLDLIQSKLANAVTNK